MNYSNYMIFVYINIANYTSKTFGNYIIDQIEKKDCDKQNLRIACKKLEIKRLLST